jgi:hypothetical protein
MRAVWRPECGDGEAVQHIIDRSKTTLRGHPTWKLFVDTIPQPIVRGSKQEPPRYVYLDDQACYTVWKSQQYTDTELQLYWPFDFDHQGNIKTGRPHRGRPAWTDSEVPEIAKGRLRGKGKWYEFSGEPETTDYRPLRPATKTKMELQVEAEWAARIGQEAGIAGYIEETLDTPTNEASADQTTIPGRKPITIANGKRAESPRLDSLKSVMEPMGSRSRSTLDPSFDDLSYHPRDASSTGVLQTNLLSNPSTPPRKRKSTGPFLVSSSPPKSSSKSPDHKRAKLAELPLTTTGPSPKRKSTGPFLISSSPSESSSRSSDHKRVTPGERKGPLPAELTLAIISASIDDSHGSRGEQCLSSLPAELSELPPDDDSDREEDEFLERKLPDQNIHNTTLTRASQTSVRRSRESGNNPRSSWRATITERMRICAECSGKQTSHV